MIKTTFCESFVLDGWVLFFIIHRKGDKFVKRCISKDIPDVSMTLEEYVATLETPSTLN